MPALPASRKPVHVAIAVAFLYFAALLSLVRDGVAWQQTVSFGNPNNLYGLVMILGAFVLAMFTLFLFVLFWTIGRGNNSARIVYLVLFLVSLLAYAVFLAPRLSKLPDVVALSAWQYSIQGLSLALLFGGKAGRWFRPPTTPPPLPV